MLKPEILCHPNIPPQLHNINPRNILGEKIWKEIRDRVYAKNNYCCIACGVEKKLAKGPKWLEAHEFWNIDYMTGICTVTSIEPLCHYCHNFIHSGRLRMILGKEKQKCEIVEILEHGFKILSENNLKCFPNTLLFAKSLNCNTFNVKQYDLKINPNLKDSDFVLIFNGIKYKNKV